MRPDLLLLLSPSPRTTRRLLAAFGLLLLATGVTTAEAEPAAGRARPERRRPRVSVARDTTWILGHSTPVGFVDFAAALDARAGAGTAPEVNAAAALWRVAGPDPVPEEIRERYFRRLGIAVPSGSGDPFRDPWEIDPSEAGADASASGLDLDEELDIAQARPWSPDEFPRLAREIARADAALDRAAAASRLPGWYLPRIRLDWDPRDDPFTTPHPLASMLTTYLRARATLRIDAGRPDAAAEDILAMHRLARRVARGPTVVERLWSCALEAQALETTCLLLHHAPPEPAVLRSLEREIRSLLPRPALVDAIDTGERILFLDYLASLERDPSSILSLRRGRERSVFARALWHPLLRGLFDWDAVFRTAIDSLVGAYLDRLPVDPFAVAPAGLRYRREGEGYAIWSVGPDGEDAGDDPEQQEWSDDIVIRVPVPVPEEDPDDEDEE